MAAAVDRGAGESDSSAASDGIASADRLVSFTVPVVGESGGFEVSVTCGSFLRSVFDEPGGRDFAMLEGASG